MSRIGFIFFYLLGMVPTYILPYFGSNSLLAQGVAAAATHSGMALWGTAAHLGALALCIYSAWARGLVSGHRSNVAFPILAAVFDFVPVLSAIPLIPTLMHVFGLYTGLKGNAEVKEGQHLPLLAANPILGIGAIAGLVLVGGYVGGLAGRSADVPSTPQPRNLNSVPQTKANVTRTPALSAQPLMSTPVPQASTPYQPYGSNRVVPAIESNPSIDARQSPSEIYAAAQQTATIQQSPAAAQAALDAVAESKRLIDLRAADDAKRDAMAKRAADVNALLITPASQEMANKYLESFVGFASAGNLPQAVALFEGSANQANTIQRLANTATGPISAKYAAPLFESTGTSSTEWGRAHGVQGTLQLRVQLTGPAIGENNFFGVTLTLDDNNRFIAVSSR